MCGRVLALFKSSKRRGWVPSWFEARWPVWYNSVEQWKNHRNTEIKWRVLGPQLYGARSQGAKKKNRFTAETKKKIQKQLLCNKNFMNYSAVERYLFFFVMEKGESEFFSRSVLDSGRVISKWRVFLSQSRSRTWKLLSLSPASPSTTTGRTAVTFLLLMPLMMLMVVAVAMMW